jgi:uncharacterized protein with beta-barrel porin domain
LELDWNILKFLDAKGKFSYLGIYGDDRGSTEAYFSGDAERNRFITAGNGIGRHGFGLEIAADFRINAALSLGASYRFQYRADSSSHGGALAMGYVF